MVHNIILGRTESDMKKFGERGAAYIGKQYITMEKVASLAGRVLLDVTRPHVLLIAGKRGSGKCLTGDTLVALNDGSVKQIKDLESDTNSVLSLSKNLKIEKNAKSAFFKRTVDRILHIKLRSGREIKLTPEHPLLTIKGWETAESLNVGSRIATPRKLEFFGDKEIRDSEIKLLAYLIAEGHLSNRFVLFSNTDQEIFDDFSRAVKEFDSNLTIKQHSKKYCYRISQINKKYKHRAEAELRNSKGQFIFSGMKPEKSALTKWLINVGIYGKLSAGKFIPEIIFKLPKYQLALFLNRLFSCDGSIYCHKTTHGSAWQVSYSSSSEILIKQVQHLLLRFGILSRLRTKNVKCRGKYFKSFELVLNSDNVESFIKEIGFHGYKRELQKQALNHLERIKKNPNVDTIPKEIWDIYRPNNWAELGRAVGYAYPKAMRERIFYCPSRQTLLQIAQVEQNYMLYLLAVSNIFWDEISSIEELKGKFDVYDISVPNNHNFVANDIIVHNSYTMGSICEGMAALDEEVRNNIGVVILDTMGIFWTMKYPNFRDEQLLDEWGLEPQGFSNVKVYVPEGVFDKMKEDGIPVDYAFTLSTSDLSGIEWCQILDVEMNHPIGIAVAKAVNILKKKGEFGIDDMINEINMDTTTDNLTKSAAANRFEAVKEWGLFSKHGTKIKDIVRRGEISVMDISQFQHTMGGFSIRALIIGLTVKRLLEERIKARKIEELADIEKGWTFFGEEYEKKLSEQVPLVWIMVDEAHEFLPDKGKNAATDPLIQAIREGRQPGVSLVLATQQPGKIHSDVITQCDLIISHRVTSKLDIDALNNIMQTYLPFAIGTYLDELPKNRGTALVLDDKQERIYPMQIRPRMTWHGGEEPSAIPTKPKIEI